MGVNKYKLGEEDQVEVLSIDNTLVLEKQIARINSVRANRDKAKVSSVHRDNYRKTPNLSRILI